MPGRENFWGSLIRDLREGQEITQRTLATRAGVNRSTLRAIESGETSGSMETIEAVLSFLGYELEVMESETRAERLRRQAEIESDPVKRSALAAKKLLGKSISLLLVA